MSPRFCYSHDGEHFSGNEPTRDDAMWEAAHTEGDPGETVTVETGVVVPYVPRITPPMIESLVESLQMQAWETVGEYGEEFLVGVDDHAIALLADGVDAFFQLWLKEVNLQPTFFAVADLQSHTVTVPMDVEESV